MADAVDIDSYIEQFPPEIQSELVELRKAVHDAVPKIEEKISWGMPTFVHNGIVIQFAAHTKHIGLYPGPEAIVEFKDRLEGFTTTKGGIQLPFDKPLPIDIVKDLAIYNDKRNSLKKKK